MLFRVRRWNIVLGVTLGVLGIVIGGAVALVFLRGRTPAIRDETGRVLARSIAELRWLQVGGARQAVLLRGADSASPVALFLHGGPGMPAMYPAHAFQRPLERDFLLVQWDRRGAGKSYGARVPADSLTIRRRGATSFWPLLRTGLLAPEYTRFDALNVQRGVQLLGATVARTAGPPLPPGGTSLSVPVFFFLGRYDCNTPSEVAARYPDSLIAPLKAVDWFEHSAHFPFFAEPEGFPERLLRVDSLVSRAER